MKKIKLPCVNHLRALWLFFIIFSLQAAQLIDLEKDAQDFVLETKQIMIPGFPGAFNASITRWRGRLLMCFRIRDDKMVSTFETGFVWLDDNFNPISTPQILEIRGKNPSSYAKNQDPRLIVINQRLYILYSNFIKIQEVVTRRMFIAQVHCEEETFFIINPLCLHSFERLSKRWEKNWTPFTYRGSLLLAYSLIPHHILTPSLELGDCFTRNSTLSSIDWQWGELRGGTPALLDGSEYVAFFHSSKYMATTHSEGKKMQHYFMGAYTFSSRPPFKITRISSQPIVSKNFYNGTAYTTWKPLRVVFPMGCIIDENYVWVSYGRQDFEIWVAKFDKKGLYQSLIPCTEKTGQQFYDIYQKYSNEVDIENSFDDFDEDFYEVS